MSSGGLSLKKVRTLAPAAAAFLLAGIVIGFLANPAATRPASTVTIRETATFTVTVAETTLQRRNMPMPYAASAAYACIFSNEAPPANVSGCPEPGTKAVTVTVKFTEMGAEKSYIHRDGVTVLTPGLSRKAQLEGSPVDASGRIIIYPNRFDTVVTATIEVIDLYSFVNWMRDIGEISLVFKIVDENNQHVQDVQVEGVTPFGGTWSPEKVTGSG